MQKRSDSENESEADYFARRANDCRRAARAAASDEARRFHLILAETYQERARMFASGVTPDTDEARLMVNRAIAIGLAGHGAAPETRMAHRAIALEYERRGRKAPG